MNKIREILGDPNLRKFNSDDKVTKRFKAVREYTS